MLVTIKFKLDHTWDEYKDINKELILEDMIDKMEPLKTGVESIEIVNIETEGELLKIAHNNIATTELRIGNMLSGMNCYRTASIFYILQFSP